MNCFKAFPAPGLGVQQHSAVLQLMLFSLHWGPLGRICPIASVPPYRLHIVFTALSESEVRRRLNTSQQGFPYRERPSPLLLTLLCNPLVTCLRQALQCTHC